MFFEVKKRESHKIKTLHCLSSMSPQFLLIDFKEKAYHLLHLRIQFQVTNFKILILNS